MLTTARMLRFCLGVLLLSLSLACGPQPEILLLNRLSEPVELDVYGPKDELRGGCTDDFRQRFCTEEFTTLSILSLQAGEERVFTMSDDIDDDQCTNVLWIRLLQVGDVGPVSERGTLLQLPLWAEIEEGSLGSEERRYQLRETGQFALCYLLCVLGEVWMSKILEVCQFCFEYCMFVLLREV